MEKLIKPLIIAGPTASGKSKCALEMAEKENGVIINADSMQVYRELPILTAQPRENDMHRVPHKLYGFLDGHSPCSVARWRQWAVEEIGKHQRPIIVGGTGMYLSALTKGLSAVPEVGENIRQKARDLMDDLGPEGFHKILSSIDPEVAEKLAPQDRQRQLRAYEVMKSTGKSLLEWQAMPLVEEGIECDIHVIDRPREELHQRCADRFDQMIDHGALDEVRRLLVLNYSPDLPVMKALGVPELTAVLQGRLSLDEAKELSVIATRQYIKRQSTWFRNQFPKAQRFTIS